MTDDKALKKILGNLSQPSSDVSGFVVSHSLTVSHTYMQTHAFIHPLIQPFIHSLIQHSVTYCMR